MSSLPAAFLERLSRIIPPEQLPQVLQSFEKKPPVCFRANTLRTSSEDLSCKLAAQSFSLEKVSGYSGAYLLKQGNLRELQETESYKQGEIYIQGLSSMLPAIILNPQPGEKVLDLCAAPGSKTSQLLCLMQGQGLLIANEKNRPRFFKLKTNMENQFGACKVRTGLPDVIARSEAFSCHSRTILGGNPDFGSPPKDCGDDTFFPIAMPDGLYLTLYPGEYFGRNFKGTFDKILVDAPCSSEGRFNTSNPKSYRYWKPAKIKEMSRQQKILLGAALSAIRPGGKIVYSTCTFAPEENEEVLEWALHKKKGKIEFEKIQLPLIIPSSAGRLNWGGRTFSNIVSNAVRVLPSEISDSFFIAAIHC